MSISYKLVDGKVEATIDTPAKEDKKDLGEKLKVVAELESKIAGFQSTIAAVTGQKTEAEATLATINNLE